MSETQQETTNWDVEGASAQAEPFGGRRSSRFGLRFALTEFMAEPLAFMRHRAQAGECTRLRLGPKPFVFVFQPEAALEILVKRTNIYLQNRNVFDRIQPVTGKGGLVQL